MKDEQQPLLFELSANGKQGSFYPQSAAREVSLDVLIPKVLLRDDPTHIPQVSEPEIVRHFTMLSQKNFSIDTHFYPLGSCTMKYNPRITEVIAGLPDLLQVHPYQGDESTQGLLGILYEMQHILSALSGMDHITLQPAAGAHGEFTGLKIIMAYHAKHGERKRTKVIVPDSSHGTNPATAALCGCDVIEIASSSEGLIDCEALAKVLGDDTACIMLTNPNTLGLFERDIMKIADMVHKAGAFLYYDGANMNALLDIVRPGDMGFDVMHFNLHKTFATPHGGGGPGSGPVGVTNQLAEFLPVPVIAKEKDGSYHLHHDLPDSMGKIKAFYGNISVVVKAYCYIKLLGAEGLKRVSEDAVLSANYLKKKIEPLFSVPYSGTCMHEFVLTTAIEGTALHAVDVGKRLLDYGFHAPTVSFPLIVPDALMIEPTETEPKERLDAFVAALAAVRGEMDVDPEHIKNAPHTMPVKRCDEVKAARTPNLT